MNLKALLDQVNLTKARVDEVGRKITGLLDASKFDEAYALEGAMKDAKKEHDQAWNLYMTMKSGDGDGESDPARRFVPTGGDPEPRQITELRGSPQYAEQFFNALQSGVNKRDLLNQPGDRYSLLRNALTETGGSSSASEGGILLPLDFDNMIREQQRLAVDLAPWVNVEEVNAYSGWRAVEVAAAALPFAAINYSAGVAEMESPTFKQLDYTLVDYGGYLPISNNLLTDTPVAIMTYLARWCGRKKSLTNTSRILTIMNALSPVNVTDANLLFDAIDYALDITLDPAISAMAAIFCNQTGFYLMDNAKDGTGRPILNPDPANATRKVYKGRPIVALSTAQQPNLSTNTYTPILVGDGHEVMSFFAKAAGEMASTTVGGDSWRKGNTEIRYIMRCDEVAADTAAMSLLKVTIPS